ncbi:hypothetical protein PtB15_4B507 [Puccinia triticina]|nr:hypothetical protein PtB15_4B507 [Puccinia triticina]
MAQNKFGRDIRLLNLLMLIVLVGQLSGSEEWSDYFHWAERVPKIDDIFLRPGSSVVTAAGKAEDSTDHLHPNGIPVRPSAIHPHPPPAYYPPQTTAEELPARSLARLDPSLGPDKPHGPNLGDTHDLDYLQELSRDGTPGSDGPVAAEASQVHSGMPHDMDSHCHTIIDAGPSDVPAVSDDSFPPSSEATSELNQRDQPAVESLKPQTGRGTRKRKHGDNQPAAESLKPQTARGNIATTAYPTCKSHSLPKNPNGHSSFE